MAAKSSSDNSQHSCNLEGSIRVAFAHPTNHLTFIGYKQHCAMRMLPTISIKKKEPLLPQTIEDSQEKTADAVKENPDLKKVKVSVSGSKASKKKKIIDYLIHGTASLFTTLFFVFLWLAPGKIIILLKFNTSKLPQFFTTSAKILK